MESKPLASSIKHPIHIRVGDQKTEFHSGCSVIDVTFPNVFYVEVFIFLKLHNELLLNAQKKNVYLVVIYTFSKLQLIQ